MAFRRTHDGDEPVRVNKWLAQAGVASRREVEDLIARGLVLIDGQTVTDPGRKILPRQTLEIRDARADAARGAAPSPTGGGATQTPLQRVTLVLNKPVGLVSAQPERGQVPAARMVLADTQWTAPGARPAPVPPRDLALAPLGRLDMDSRGLLILSTDGVLAKAVIGPTSQVDKEYLVRLRGPLDDRRIALLRHGLRLDGRALRPARVTREGRDVVRMVLTEGRNRQIRRMAELVGLEVTDLMRVRIGCVALEGLPEGRWRALTPDERAGLVAMA